MGYFMPRQFAAATRTYYLLNGQNDQPKSLVLLPKAWPDSVMHLSLKSLPKFQPPRRPREIKFTIGDEVHDYTFYVDSAQPHRIRYVRRPAANWRRLYLHHLARVEIINNSVHVGVA